MQNRCTFTRAQRAALLAPAVIMACSGDGGLSNSPPASAAITSTATVTATVGTLVNPAPSFVVRDASGKALSGVAVSIAVGAGGGTLTGAPTTSSANGTSVGSWTLGTASGVNTLVVTVTGLATPLTISATGTADVASQLTVSSGNAQSGLAGGTLAAPVTFKVGDRFNNGVSQVAVSFSVTGGGGSLAAGSATVVSDANGLAVAPTWTLGKSTGPQSLRGTAGAFNVAATATVLSDYFLDVRFYGAAISTDIQQAFYNAASRIQGLLTGDVVNVNLTAFDVAASCGVTGVPPLSETIDEIIVYAKVDAIDGPGGILGSAGPCIVRSAGQLPVIATMNFDSADLQLLLADGRLASVILHEMLHTVGVGTLWGTKQMTINVNTANVAYIGAQAVAGCIFHGGTLPLQCGSGNVPVQSTGGSGTANVHWRENTTSTGIGLDQELMTGFAEPAGVPMPLSRITIGSLQDIGYTVNLLPADFYSYPSVATAALAQIREAQGLGKFELNELLREPVAMVDVIGRVTPIKPRQ
jgi:hypothetical protein